MNRQIPSIKGRTYPAKWSKTQIQLYLPRRPRATSSLKTFVVGVLSLLLIHKHFRCSIYLHSLQSFPVFDQGLRSPSALRGFKHQRCWIWVFTLSNGTRSPDQLAGTVDQIFSRDLSPAICSYCMLTGNYVPIAVQGFKVFRDPMGVHQRPSKFLRQSYLLWKALISSPVWNLAPTKQAMYCCKTRIIYFPWSLHYLCPGLKISMLFLIIWWLCLSVAKTMRTPWGTLFRGPPQAADPPGSWYSGLGIFTQSVPI